MIGQSFFYLSKAIFVPNFLKQQGIDIALIMRISVVRYNKLGNEIVDKYTKMFVQNCTD
jgi:hypothetical protein